MRTIWIVSDSHFGHRNIIDYCGRPFDSVESMNEAMVERWNAVVKPQDKVYHLGDFVINKKWIDIGKMLNGHKRLVIGNHDPIDTHLAAYQAAGFEKFYSVVEKFKGMVLTHVPIHPMTVGRWKTNLHGHIHEKTVWIGGTSEPDYRYINMCVEHNGYAPVALEAIASEIVRRKPLIEQQQERYHGTKEVEIGISTI